MPRWRGWPGAPGGGRPGPLGGPDRTRVTDLVVDPDLLHPDVVVPIIRVARAVDGVVHLDMDVDEFMRLPTFAEVEYAHPDPSWEEREGFAPTTALVSLRGVMPAGVMLISAPAGLLVWEHTHAGLSPEEMPPQSRDAHHVSRRACRSPRPRAA